MELEILPKTKDYIYKTKMQMILKKIKIKYQRIRVTLSYFAECQFLPIKTHLRRLEEEHECVDT